MKKSIILSTQQIKHLQEHGTITTVGMAKPKLYQQVYVREMWAINENIPKSINVHSYFADWDSNWIIGGMIWPDEIGILETDEAWQSAVTMPRSASRYTLECTEVQRVKVRDVTEDTKYGQGVWDNNEYIFITTFKLVNTR